MNVSVTAPADLALRDQRPGDRLAVRRVVEAAFGRADEADLVERLHADGDIDVACVAHFGEAVAGHVLFSRLAIETHAGFVPGAALAPLAVHPAHQRRGIGDALVRHGLARCREADIPFVVVLGDPAYYPRFGFSAAAAAALAAPFSGDAFMALALDPTLATPLAGRVHYAPAFGLAT